MHNSIFNHPDIRVIISTRLDGSMKLNSEFQTQTIQKFLKRNGMIHRLYTMSQVHGITIRDVSGNEPNPIPNTDGMITKKKDVLLGVVTADCLPIIFYDPSQSFTAAIHAGYKGILNGIIQETIQELIKKGSNVSELLVGIGPAIGVCCYDIPNERVQTFSEAFGNGYCVKKDDKSYLDLKKLSFDILTAGGVNDKKIDIMDICTKCQNDTYFSYRGDSNESFGVMLTVIGN